MFQSMIIFNAQMKDKDVLSCSQKQHHHHIHAIKILKFEEGLK